MTPEELQDLFDARLDDHVVESGVAWGQLTVTLDAEGYVNAAELARDHDDLAMDFFDCLIGVDEREDGFAVIANLYSTTTRQRVLLRHLCAGGREAPVAPSLTHLYRGADWHEREAWDMFGIEFDGHPGLAPRILTAENFEGWPLRKDFYLATREAKPWPGIKEPLELDDEGNPVDRVVEKGAGAAPGPMPLDEAMAEQARRAAGELEDDETVEIEGKEVDPDAPRTSAPEGSAVGATPDEEASARAERARKKAAEMRAKKRAEAGEESQSERAERAAEESQEQQTALRHDRGQGGPPGEPPAPGEPQKQGTTPADETPTDHTTGGGPGSTPEQAGGPSPGAEAGEPPSTQEPGEAPVEGGLRETIDEERDAEGLAGGERPGSVGSDEDDQDDQDEGG